MLRTGECRQRAVAAMLVLGMLSVAVNASGTKHVPDVPLPPEMKIQPDREAPRIPAPPGEPKQYPTPQPPQKVDPSRPVMRQIEFDVVRVRRM